MTVTTSIADLTAYINHAIAGGSWSDVVSAAQELIDNMNSGGAGTTTAGQTDIAQLRAIIADATLRSHGHISSPDLSPSGAYGLGQSVAALTTGIVVTGSGSGADSGSLT